MEKRRLSTLLSKRASYIDSVVSDYVTVARQAPLSTGFSRQEYESGLSCLPSWDLPNPGPNPGLPPLLHCWQFFTTEPLGKPHTPLVGM